jgi:hypothetical protein
VPNDDVEDITNSFYVYNHAVYARNKILVDVKPEDVIVLDPDDKAYVRINTEIFYYDTVIAGANPETFAVIAGRFAKDDQHVYWSEHRVVDIDPATFIYQKNLYAAENAAGEYRLATAEY